MIQTSPFSNILHLWSVWHLAVLDFMGWENKWMLSTKKLVSRCDQAFLGARWISETLMQKNSSKISLEILPLGQSVLITCRTASSGACWVLLWCCPSLGRRLLWLGHTLLPGYRLNHWVLQQEHICYLKIKNTRKLITSTYWTSTYWYLIWAEPKVFSNKNIYLIIVVFNWGI